MDDVLFPADGCEDGGGFGGAEEGEGRFGEHLSHVVQTLVVDGLAHGGGGDDLPVGQLLSGSPAMVPASPLACCMPLTVRALV